MLASLDTVTLLLKKKTQKHDVKKHPTGNDSVD
jgi:hypothetical protein